MNIDLDRRLTALFDELADQVPVEPLPPLALRSDRVRTHQGGIARRALMGAAAVALLVGGLAVAATITRDNGPAATSPHMSAATPDGTNAAPTRLFTAPAQHIEWSVISPESSIGQAQISAIAAGPGGFVAVGMGFDGRLSDGQGRVWFSTDGENWSEPNHDLFARQGAYTVTATATAYYLYAVPTPPTEGSPAQPAQLYRSSSGTEWDPVGEPIHDPGQVIAVGDVLVRTGMSDGGLLTSTDALTWTAAQLVPVNGVSSDVTYFDDRLAQANGIFYLRSWDDKGEWGLWASLDGTTWTEVPPPTTPGRLTGTEGGLLSIGDPNEDACRGLNPADDADAALNAQWGCEVTPTVERYAADALDWTIIGAGPATPSPMLPGVTAFGNQLIASVVRPDGGMSVWTSTDGRSWSPTPIGTDPQPQDLEGSPQALWVSGQNASTLVIPVSSNGVGDVGQLVVGRITANATNAVVG